MIFFLLIFILCITGYLHPQDWFLRASGVVTLVAMLAGLALSVPLSYIRFLDWRRAAAIEASASKA